MDDTLLPAELERANQELGRLTSRLEQAIASGSAENVLRVGQEAEALRRMLEVARFDLKCQNRFWHLRVQALRGFGEMLRLMEKHPGGRPGAKAPPPGRRFVTIGDIQTHFSLSDRFIQLCREIAALDPRDMDSYVARGQADPPLVLRFKGPEGLLHHAGWEATRRWNAQDRQKRTEHAYAHAEAAAAATEPELEVEIPQFDVSAELMRVPPRPEAPEPPQMPKQMKSAETIKAALRKAVDVVKHNPNEAISAMETVRRLDPRLDTLNQRDDFRLLKSYRESQQFMLTQSTRLYNQIQGLQEAVRQYREIDETLKKYQARDRERLRVIRDLRAQLQETTNGHAAPLRQSDVPIIRREFADRVVHYCLNCKGLKGPYLDCCCGLEGGFYPALPVGERHWCEKDRGRDFLKWHKRVGTILTNPPWGRSFEAIALHAYEIADDIVFLLRGDIMSIKRTEQYLGAGFDIEKEVVVRWEDAFVNTPGGFKLVLLHLQRGYKAKERSYWLD
jgi:hypothetical protein